MGLLTLSYACGWRARILAELGDCPPDITAQIRDNLRSVYHAIGGNGSARMNPHVMNANTKEHKP